jgi:RecJ OB domain/DHHA1 domain
VDERFTSDPTLADAYCIVIDGEAWHRGVIGITATRIVERYNRPTLVISRDGEEAFGSGRSIRAFHLLEAVESCGSLFSRYGGHSDACGFAMPAANIAELRARLDQFARTRLTLADFDPILDLDAELNLTDVTPELFQVLALLEPYGMGNYEPVFAARGVQLTAPPRILKDKHVKLKLRQGHVETTGHMETAGHVEAALGRPSRPEGSAALAASGMLAVDPSLESSELSSAAILATPRCHPDGAAIRRSERASATAEAQGSSLTADLRSKITFDALGWHMAERLQQSPLLAGDSLDIAFTIGNNDHPKYGGLELSLRDLRVPVR